MMDFNWVDYSVLAILFISVLAGFARGFVKEILSVLTWVISFVVATMFASKLASAFTDSSTIQSAVTDASSAVGVDANQSISLLGLGLSFISIFLVVLIIGSLLTHIISGAVESTGLGFVNRFFGSIFGFLRGLLITLIIVIIVQLTAFENAKWWKESVVIPYFQPAVEAILNLVYPEFENLRNKMTKSIDQTAQSLVDNIYQYRG